MKTSAFTRARNRHSDAQKVWVKEARETLSRREQGKQSLSDYMRLVRGFGFAIGADCCEDAPWLMDLEVPTCEVLERYGGKDKYLDCHELDLLKRRAKEKKAHIVKHVLNLSTDLDMYYPRKKNDDEGAI